MVDYVQPKSLNEAAQLLGERSWQLLAGGTDFYPSLGEQPVQGPVLDISRIEGLRSISKVDGGWRIGAASTWTDLINASLPAAFDALKLAAREVGSVQIQNRATLVGNICNASPAADGVPGLMVLDAEVEMAAAGATRSLPLAEFILGNRRTALNQDEMVTGLFIPESATGGQSSFFKLGARKYLVISIAMVAARVEIDDNNKVAAAAVSVGACSEIAQRLSKLEADLKGVAAADIAGAVTPQHLESLSPIDDVRAPATYRHEAALESVRRALTMAVEGAA